MNLCHEIIRSQPPLSVDFFATKKFGCPTTPKIALSDKLYLWLKMTKTCPNPHWNICAYPRSRVTYFCLGNEKTWCFFAAIACHILAHMFLSLDPNEGSDLIYTKPVKKQPGKHAYESNGTWAFDFNGWSSEKTCWKLIKRMQKIDIQTGTMSASL